MLSLDALRALDAIERKKSFAAAAQELHRVPSALTYIIKKLEEDLGIELFDRSGHRAELTPAGYAVLEEGRRILKSAASLPALANHVAKGWERKLHITVDIIIPDEAVWPVVHALTETCHHTAIQVTRSALSSSWENISESHSDLVIGAPGDAPTNLRAKLTQMGTIEHVFTVAPTHPLASLPGTLSDDQIREYRSICIADANSGSEHGESGVIDGQTVLSVPDYPSKIEALTRGLGVGFLPIHYAHQAVQNRQLVVKSTQHPKAPIPLFMVWRERGGQALRYAVKAFSNPTLFPVNEIFMRNLDLTATMSNSGQLSA